MNKQEQYDQVRQRLDALCAGETDPIALMATIACELYHGFATFDWVGFYRKVDTSLLKIGPYQGGHGCLAIPFDKGICGQCACERKLLNIADVHAVPHHIACASATQSELVLPIMNGQGDLLAILDIDSDQRAAFDEIDERNLSHINDYFNRVDGRRVL